MVDSAPADLATAVAEAASSTTDTEDHKPSVDAAESSPPSQPRPAWTDADGNAASQPSSNATEQPSSTSSSSNATPAEAHSSSPGPAASSSVDRQDADSSVDSTSPADIPAQSM